MLDCIAAMPMAGSRSSGFAKFGSRRCYSTIAVLMIWVIPAISAAAPGTDINLSALDAIYIGPQAHSTDEKMARVLQKRLKKYYNLKLPVRREVPGKGKPGLLLGKEIAIAAGELTLAELESVKHDGYLMRDSADRVVLAGYGPQGTIYATYAFLRHIGIRIYPWRPSNGVEVFERPEKEALAAFSVTEKPYFGLRDVLPGRGKGRFGATIREYALGDLKFARDHEYFMDRGYLGWDHTAAYLVPMARYGKEHPEYFAPKRLRDRFKVTPNLGVRLCLCEPDVARIAIERLLDWMDIQPGRRYFAVTNGDSTRQCPQCRLANPVPDYTTDQLLDWVNSIARHVRAVAPEKRLLTLAYLDTVKPPLHESLEPNIIVMYAPWYWTSRATSAVGFEHPVNITMMDEFLGWSMRFPGQVGVYDYPGKSIYGTADRIKFLARNDVAGIYLNGPQGDLLHWIATQLLWDPFQNVEELQKEYLDAVYGPAAGPLQEYYRARKETLARSPAHSKFFFSDREFLHKASRALEAALLTANSADTRTRERIIHSVADFLLDVLQDNRAGVATASELWPLFRRYLELQRQRLDDAEQHGAGTKQAKRVLRNIIKSVSRLTGGKKAGNHYVSEMDTDRDMLWRAFEQDFESMLVRRDQRRSLFSFSPPRSVYSGGEEFSNALFWSVSASEPRLADSPRSETEADLQGRPSKGVRIDVPLSRLPVVKRGNIDVHAGRFHIEKTFETPLQGKGLPYFDIRLKSSHAVPITVYLKGNAGFASDINVYAGEQIVRIDLRNFPKSDLDPERWDGSIRRIGIDIWPQDNFFPYPAVRDIHILFMDAGFSNRQPVPEMLPYHGSSLWMTHFRPNIPYGAELIKSIAEKLRDSTGKRGDYNAVSSAYRTHRTRERFRTFTEHRLVSPVFAILTGNSRDSEVIAAARELQIRLEHRFGVRLPIDPPGYDISPDTTNVIMIGRAAALASGGVSGRELHHAGRQGFVIRARNGRIVIAGTGASGTRRGIVRFLEHHAIDRKYLGNPAERARPVSGLLHELYLIDRPFFSDYALDCRDDQYDGSGDSGSGDAADSGMDAIESARSLAASIKDLARKGATKTTLEIREAAEASPLSCYVADKLLWNPFIDINWLTLERTNEPQSEYHAFRTAVPVLTAE